MYNSKIKKYYPHIAEVFKKYKDRVSALDKEIMDAIMEGISEEDKNDNTMSIPTFFTSNPWIQVYVTEPSEGAVFGHEEQDVSGDPEYINRYYGLEVDGIHVTECVGKDWI